MATFQIHFLILENSGEGWLHECGISTYIGRGMADINADDALGSKVTIRHVNTQGG
ncbi:hypothetical protein EDB86DRAFT_2957426 [Lactarius hatsudake]|nr:hypothetical protein EDB86DRAFT_2957426 [Lactarius hatsudake]